jgi:hypothetical protein
MEANMKQEKWDDLRDRLYVFLDGNPGKVYKSQQLAKELGVANRDYQAFKRMVKHLSLEGRLIRHKGNAYRRKTEGKSVTGVLEIKSGG